MSVATLEMQLAFLESRGARSGDHSLTTLLDHLMGTRELLMQWQADEALCTAGLFHSVYGTESFQLETVSLADRDLVRSVTGDDCEEIVYLFAVMTPDSFAANLQRESGYEVEERTTGRWLPLGPQRFRQLCSLSAANWLEQRERLPGQLRSAGRERYVPMLKFLLPGAVDAICAAYNISRGGKTVEIESGVSTADV